MIATMEELKRPPKVLCWIASARKDLVAMPRAVQRKVDFALYLAQIGEKHPATKASKDLDLQACWKWSRTSE